MLKEIWRWEQLARDLGLGGSARLSFANFYEDPALRLYADHGN